MKLARVIHENKVTLALVEEGKQEVVLIGGAMAFDANPVRTVIERRTSENHLRRVATGRAGFHDVTFLAPFSSLVRNLFAVGKNYADHAREFDKSGFNATSAAAVPTAPQFFTKATTSLAGPTDDIVFDPTTTSAVDYEGEIGVVIAEECRHVLHDQALSKVYGFIVLNDVTARDLQRDHAQWFLGKSLDTFCPVGPWITTIDEAPIASLNVRTWVNNELRQEAPLSNLIFNIPTLIQTLSRAMTLLAGDIIATGTPVGVGIGFEPPRFLREGDVVRVAAPGLGETSNTVRQM
jgi:2-keto-4-pentenoate hydratase/2-oxohepta-3-ene-1,7-dioic acid hydratase in catechol pathway